jgi:hypothetical protein
MPGLDQAAWYTFKCPPTPGTFSSARGWYILGARRGLYSFGSQGKDDGVFPNGSFTLAAGGVIYGTTIETAIRRCYKHGVSCGTVFKLTPVGSSYQESVVFRFHDVTQGNIPLSGLLAVGNTLFGETGFGGSPGCSFAGHPGCGAVFALVAASAPPRAREAASR